MKISGGGGSGGRDPRRTPRPEKPKEYTVTRDRVIGYIVHSPEGSLLGCPITLWGAKKLIHKDKKGFGPGSVAYTEGVE